MAITSFFKMNRAFKIQKSRSTNKTNYVLICFLHNIKKMKLIPIYLLFPLLYFKVLTLQGMMGSGRFKTITMKYQRYKFSVQVRFTQINRNATVWIELCLTHGRVATIAQFD